MSTQTVCDQCGARISMRAASYRVTRINTADRPPRDYCSARCTIAAFGGTVRGSEGHTVTIPWPPSAEMEAAVLHALKKNLGRPWDAVTCAVLDVIRGAQ